MKVYDFPQRSPEWYAVRTGLPTASGFDNIVTTKGELSKQAEKYLYRLAGEKVIGFPEETYQNDAMKRGVELEPEARLCYELITGNTVKQVGLCVSDDGYGASPDGMVGDDGLIEIKAPSLAVHVGYLVANEFPMAYWQQCQGQMLVTGRKYVDFVSYYPSIKTFVIRLDRDEVFIGKLESELKKFVKQLNEVITKIK